MNDPKQPYGTGFRDMRVHEDQVEKHGPNKTETFVHIKPYRGDRRLCLHSVCIVISLVFRHCMSTTSSAAGGYKLIYILSRNNKTLMISSVKLYVSFKIKSMQNQNVVSLLYRLFIVACDRFEVDDHFGFP